MRLLEDNGVDSDGNGAESWALTWHRHGLVSRAREEKKKGIEERVREDKTGQSGVDLMLVLWCVCAYD